MKSTKLLTILSIGIASWTHSCVKKKETGDKTVTAESCKDQRMKFNETTKKCIPPDAAFCSGLSLGFRESPPQCIAGTGTGVNPVTTQKDSDIAFAWQNADDLPTAVASVHNRVGRVTVTTTNKKDPYDIRLWQASNSSCTLSTTPPELESGGSIHVNAAAPAGTKECKIKILAVNRQTNKYRVSEEFTIKFKP